MKLKDSIKDWQITRDVLGKNTHKECKIIKELRKAIESEEICEGWWMLRTKEHIDNDEVGWLIPIEYLE
jgi:hypothetical protein